MIEKIKKSHLFYLVPLILFVFIAYINSFNNDFIFDDVNGILRNPQINDLYAVFSKGIEFWRPLLYYLSYQVGANIPFYYRVVNFIFHIGAVCCGYGVIYSTTKKRQLAFMTATLFAVHPLISEPVVWISGGSYPTYGFFLLLSFQFYLLSKSNSLHLVFSIIAFIAALLSSEKALIFPLILFLYDVVSKKQTLQWNRLVPFFFLSAVYFLLLIPNTGSRINYFSEGQGISHAVRNPFQYMPFALTSYLQLSILPQSMYPHFKASMGSIEYIVRLFATIGFFCLMVYWYKKNRLLFFWLAFFVITLIPTLLPININADIAERYVYLGSLGLFFCFAYFFYYFGTKEKYRYISYSIFVVIVTILMITTVVENKEWKNDLSFNEAAIRQFPDDYILHHSLGMKYLGYGNLSSAAKEFKTVIKINPYYPQAYYNLGIIYSTLKDIDSSLAFSYYEKSAEVNENFWPAYYKMGVVYRSRDDFKNAEKNLLKAIELAPHYIPSYTQLAYVYMLEKRNVEAKKMLNEALDRDPNDTIAPILLRKIQ